MQRNGHRRGRKQVNVVVSAVLHAQVRDAARRVGLSQQEWLVEALREKVSRDAGHDRAGDGRDAGAVGGGFRDEQGGGREPAAGERAGDAATGSHERGRLVGGENVPLWAEAVLGEDRGGVAERDSRHLRLVDDTVGHDEWASIP